MVCIVKFPGQNIMIIKMKKIYDTKLKNKNKLLVPSMTIMRSGKFGKTVNGFIHASQDLSKYIKQ